MNRPARLLVATIASLLWLGCAMLDVGSDYDPGVDFSAYRTFGWLHGAPDATGDIRLDNPLLHARIASAVESELAAKGYTKSESPDLRVGYHVSLEKKIDVTTIDRHYGYSRRWERPPHDTIVTQYEQGTLVLDLVDPRLDRLVWRGWGSRPVQEPSANPEESQRRIREAVRAILAEFPPQ